VGQDGADNMPPSNRRFEASEQCATHLFSSILVTPKPNQYSTTDTTARRTLKTRQPAPCGWLLRWRYGQCGSGGQSTYSTREQDWPTAPRPATRRRRTVGCCRIALNGRRSLASRFENLAEATAKLRSQLEAPKKGLSMVSVGSVLQPDL
jgi:hypothetical protein